MISYYQVLDRIWQRWWLHFRLALRVTWNRNTEWKHATLRFDSVYFTHKYWYTNLTQRVTANNFPYVSSSAKYIRFLSDKWQKYQDFVSITVNFNYHQNGSCKIQQRTSSTWCCWSPSHSKFRAKIHSSLCRQQSRLWQLLFPVSVKFLHYLFTWATKLKTDMSVWDIIQERQETWSGHIFNSFLKQVN